MSVPRLDALKLLNPGLDKASSLGQGHGWVDFNVKATSKTDFTANLDAGLKLSPNWAAYGTAWANSTGAFGAEAGLRANNGLNLFVGAEGTYGGSVQATAGLSWHF